MVVSSGKRSRIRAGHQLYHWDSQKSLSFSSVTFMLIKVCSFKLQEGKRERDGGREFVIYLSRFSEKSLSQVARS